MYMIYYFPKGINNDEMKIYNGMTFDGMKTDVTAKMISIFESIDVKPSDVSVWIVEDGSIVAQYLIGNPRIVPVNSIQVFALQYVEAIKFVCYTHDEDIAEELIETLEQYGGSI